MADKKARDSRGRFTKGISGNTGGRPRMPPDLKEVKNLKADYVRKIVSRILVMSPEELQQWLENPNPGEAASNMEQAVVAVLSKAIREGDHNRLSFLLDRTVGKVVEQRKLEIEAVRYVTRVREDGSLLQEVIKEQLEGASDV